MFLYFVFALRISLSSRVISFNFKFEVRASVGPLTRSLNQCSLLCDAAVMSSVIEQQHPESIQKLLIYLSRFICCIHNAMMIRGMCTGL